MTNSRLIEQTPRTYSSQLQQLLPLRLVRWCSQPQRPDHEPSAWPQNHCCVVCQCWTTQPGFVYCDARHSQLPGCCHPGSVCCVVALSVAAGCCTEVDGTGVGWLCWSKLTVGGVVKDGSPGLGGQYHDLAGGCERLCVASYCAAYCCKMRRSSCSESRPNWGCCVKKCSGCPP